MKIQSTVISAIVMLTLMLFFGLNANAQQKLKEGDLLFQDLNCGDLCNAIEAVTKGVNGKHFSHCAMVVKINDTLKVVEAIGSYVQQNTLYNFFARSGDTNTVKNITIARVNKANASVIKKAAIFAINQIGKPYDDEFILNNNKWYCSELVYEAYKDANNKPFFELEPMTFKDPTTNTYFPAWIDYYNVLNKPIPEGKLGINPGLISRSKKIKIIKGNTLQQIQ
jgi:Permuted papain-like amidase enzyme, YaeF/YiiX, C92 family